MIKLPNINFVAARNALHATDGGSMAAVALTGFVCSVENIFQIDHRERFVDN